LEVSCGDKSREVKRKKREDKTENTGNQREEKNSDSPSLSAQTPKPISKRQRDFRQIIS
jgi:hypothetical protein